MLKVICTIVFVSYGVFATYALGQIGLPWQGMLVGGVVTLLLLYELWYSQPKEEERRQQLLREIQNFKGEIIPPPRNIMDAKDKIAILREDRDVLSDAYVDLHDAYVQLVKNINDKELDG